MPPISVAGAPSPIVSRAPPKSACWSSRLVERVFELLAHRLALLLGKVQDPVGAAALCADLQVGAALLKRVAQRLFQPFGQQLHAVLAEGVRRAVELGHEHLEAPGREVEVVVRVDPRDVRVGRDRAPL